jgi:transposase
MAEFFKTSTIWVIDFRYDGRARRWFKAFGPNAHVQEQMAAELLQLYGNRSQLVEVRKATEEEESQYLRGEEPKNLLCPTGRHS